MWIKDVKGSLINLQHATSIEIVSDRDMPDDPEWQATPYEEIPRHIVAVIVDGERRITYNLNDKCRRQDCCDLIDKIGASLNGRELLSTVREESETGESRFLPTS